jgi:hypothetical protein
MSHEPELPAAPLQEIEPLGADARKAAIAEELYRALEKLGAHTGLLALVGSYGHTLPDKAVLTNLRAYDDTGTYWQRIVCERKP